MARLVRQTHYVELLTQAAVSGLLLGGVYGLVACGLSLIFGVLRIINFAHGAVMMLGMYATYWLFTLGGIDPYASIVLVGPLFFLVGMLVQRVIIEPNRFAAEHNQLLLTLGLALFLENLALVLWQGDFRTVRPRYANASFVLGEALVEVPRLVACGGAVVMALALFAFLRRTDVGKAIRALAEEPEGALLMGIDVRRIRAVAFGIGSGCVAVAGALVTPFFYVAPDVGESFNIMAFVVVVLGAWATSSAPCWGASSSGWPSRSAPRCCPARSSSSWSSRSSSWCCSSVPPGSSGAGVVAEVLGGVALGVLLIAPPFLPPYFLEILISVLLFAYLGSAWNILGGYAGQFSFGHAAYFGIGAYTSTLLFLRLGVSPWLGMVAGGCLAAAFGLGAGYLSFRYGLRGPYFSLVTLAFAEMLRVVAVNTKAVGSSLGLVIPSREAAPWSFVFGGKLPYYYVILAMALGAVWITRRLERSKLGYSLRAIRENEDAAEAAGVDALGTEAAGHGPVVVPHRAGRHLLRAVLRLHRSDHHVRSGGVDPGAAAGTSSAAPAPCWGRCSARSSSRRSPSCRARRSAAGPASTSWSTGSS